MSVFGPDAPPSHQDCLKIPEGKQFPLDALVSFTATSLLHGYFFSCFFFLDIHSDRQPFYSSYAALLFLLTKGLRFYRSVS